jgi:hypothetical protein
MMDVRHGTDNLFFTKQTQHVWNTVIYLQESIQPDCYLKEVDKS